jgi:hypothetical protein
VEWDCRYSGKENCMTVKGTNLSKKHIQKMKVLKERKIGEYC